MNPRTKKTTEVDVVDGDTTVHRPKSWRTTISPTDPAPVVRTDPPVKKALTLVSLIVTAFLLYKLGTILYERSVAADLAKKTTACPTLLSISRSARDTLLVMRSEPLCAAYVLDSIQ